ncbi:MAG: type I-B CRISPR-associated protein Cas7/Cst2/DevR [Candidatus Thermoplasmatota archaeon]
MGRYIVMDIVFYGGSLNYDQGAGNYQELKKITKWDGKQYTLVSRYALRYSLLKTGEELGLWKKIASETILERAGERKKTVIQPSIKALLSGEILTHPEFDLFGYLITGTTPQNSRESPVKISHAISMTPYSYDCHLAGNLGYAKKMVEAGKAEKMEPNLFTIEEHLTYYIYTIVIDVDRIGKSEVYLAKKGGLSQNEESEGNVKVEEEKKGGKKKNIENITIENGDLLIKYENEKKEEIIHLDYKIEAKINNNFEKLFAIEFSLKNLEECKNRITDLIKTVLNLKRNIKARSEDLQPKLLVLGIYKDASYQTFKDRIVLTNEYEEIYEEVRESKENGVKILRRVVKLERPAFKIFGLSSSNIKPETINEKSIINVTDKLFDQKNSSLSEIHIYHAPEIKILSYETSNKTTSLP